MSFDELNALIELANRAHKSPAETLWLAALVQRLKDGQQPPADTKDQQTDSSPQQQ